MKTPVLQILCRIFLWLVLCGSAGEVCAWLWSTGTPATPHPAVARIFALDTRAVFKGTGTLVAVSSYHGLVITNWHVVRDAKDAVLVQFPDGFASPATILKVDRDWDLAALAIWRPRAKPVPIAVDPPKPGDILMIAGYGQGDYRISYGPCTQYLSPAPNLPAEFVEVRTTARHGDSGGPIFNARGELAGVLFGSGSEDMILFRLGSGYTVGAYCGRVRSFLLPLRDVFNNLPPPDILLAQAMSAGAPPVTTNGSTQVPSQAGSAPTAGSYGIAATTSGAAGSSPFQVPLVAGPQGAGSGVSAGSSPDGRQGSPGLHSYAALSSGVTPQNIAATKTNVPYGASDALAQGWRESAANSESSSPFTARSNELADSQQGASHGQSHGGEPYRSSYPGQNNTYSSGSSAGTESSYAYSGRESTRSDWSYGPSSPYGRDTSEITNSMANSRNEGPSYGGGSSWDSTSKASSAASEYGYASSTSDYGYNSSGSDYGYNSSGSGHASYSYDSQKGQQPSGESYRQESNSFASDERRSTAQGGYATAGENNKRNGERSRDNNFARNSSSGYDSSQSPYGSEEDNVPPYSYGLERTGISEYAAGNDSWGSEDGTPAGGLSSTNSLRRDRQNSRSYTASINTGSNSTKSSERDDSDEDRYSSPDQSDLSKTISPKQSNNSASTGSYSGYSAIPVYDEDDNGSRNRGSATTASKGSSSWDTNSDHSGTSSEDGDRGGSASRSSGSNSRSSWDQSGTSYRESNSGTSGSGNSSPKGYQGGKKPRSSSSSHWDGSEEHSSNSWSSSSSGRATSRNSSETGTSDSLSHGASLSSSAGNSGSTTAENGNSADDAEQASKGQERANASSTASEPTEKQPSPTKTTPGWESMIGIAGLLILFIQSMRWLSLLYDRSYYQRRRSYRPVRRRTTWTPTTPPAYRWYY